MNPRGTGNQSIDYSLGQIDTKLAIISQTLAEDRMSDAQFRTWVRERIEKLEHQDVEAMGRTKAYRNIWAFIQLAIGAVGGIVATYIERWLHGGGKP